MIFTSNNKWCAHPWHRIIRKSLTRSIILLLSVWLIHRADSIALTRLLLFSINWCYVWFDACCFGHCWLISLRAIIKITFWKLIFLLILNWCSTFTSSFIFEIVSWAVINSFYLIQWLILVCRWETGFIIISILASTYISDQLLFSIIIPKFLRKLTAWHLLPIIVLKSQKRCLISWLVVRVLFLVLHIFFMLSWTINKILNLFTLTFLPLSPWRSLTLKVLNELKSIF